MAKAKEIAPQLPTEQPQVVTEGPTKVLAKNVQLGIGVDMLGSVLSLQNRNGTELEVLPMGIRATSGKPNKQGARRVVIIPWANIRACELI